MRSLPDYSIISPVKDEIRHFARTVRAVLAQTHLPVEWVVVDDGSSDGTYELALRHAAKYPWIRVIRARTSGRRQRGAPIVRAFHEGLAALEGRPEFVVKLDGDLFFSSHYFSWVASVFRSDARAGIVGGIVFVRESGKWVYDKMDHRSVHGAIKSYRLTCLDDVGGLHESMGWDGIDEFGARARGWNVHVVSELNVLHYKSRGSAQPSLLARWEEGHGTYYMGYGLLGLARRAGYRMLVEKPHLIGGIVLALGHGWHAIVRSPRADPLARQQLRLEQPSLRSPREIFGRGRRGQSSLPGGGPAFWCTDDDTHPSEEIG